MSIFVYILHLNSKSYFPFKPKNVLLFSLFISKQSINLNHISPCTTVATPINDDYWKLMKTARKLSLIRPSLKVTRNNDGLI